MSSDSEARPPKKPKLASASESSQSVESHASHHPTVSSGFNAAHLSSSPEEGTVVSRGRGIPSLPVHIFENIWKKFKVAMHATFSKTSFSYSVQDLEQDFDDLRLHKVERKLFQKVEEEWEVHILAAFQSLLRQSTDLNLLELVQKYWEDHCEVISRIGYMFLHMKDKLVEINKNVHSFSDMGMQLFRKNLFISDVGHKIVNCLLQTIERERLGEAIDQTPLNFVLWLFMELNIYSERFEEKFLEDTLRFYAAEGERCVQDLTVPEYMRHVEVRLQQEHDRCTHYLNPSTHERLMAAAEEKLLKMQIFAILNKGFEILMDNNCSADLQKICQLFTRVNALQSLSLALFSYLERIRENIMHEAKDKDKAIAPSLLKLKALSDTVEKGFPKSSAFIKNTKEALWNFINLDKKLPAKLSKFLDEKFCAHKKGTLEEDLESMLDKVLFVFRLTEGKDLFEALYRKDLAKRLILGRTSIDVERSMIVKLETGSAIPFTYKLEQMLKDMELSNELNQSFLQSPHYPSGIRMKVQVLGKLFWPNYKPIDMIFPSELSVLQDKFNRFYHSQYERDVLSTVKLELPQSLHKKRVLEWQNSLSHCILTADFPKGRKELLVSLFQTVVLMLFNNAQRLSFQEIKISVGMEDKELGQTLQSLACGKLRILKKFPEGRVVEDSDSFEVNDAFAAPHYKLKVNANQINAPMEENTHAIGRVLKERKYKVEAAIVRLLKAKKKLSHEELITELSKTLEFSVKHPNLMIRIDDLISRGYLKRDETDNSLYHYVP